MEEKWTEITQECELRWWHLEGKGSVVQIVHNGVIALLSPTGGNMTTNPRVRRRYKIEVGESDIPAKWFRIFQLPVEEGEEGRERRARS